MLTTFLALLLTPADPAASCVRITRPGVGGSGTVVACENGKSLVLTARHVCNDDFDAPLTVTVGDAKQYPAKLAAYDTLSDLALVRVDAELPAVAVAAACPPDGTPVRQWGCTGGGKRNPKAGVTTDGGATIQANDGDSGCGVFAGNELVAVTVGKVVRGFDQYGRPLPVPGDARCVHLSDVRRVLGTVAKRSGQWPGLLKDMEAATVPPPQVPRLAPLLVPGGT